MALVESVRSREATGSNSETTSRGVVQLSSLPGLYYYKRLVEKSLSIIVQELCESRGGRPGLSVLTSLLVSVDVKNY